MREGRRKTHLKSSGKVSGDLCCSHHARMERNTCIPGHSAQDTRAQRARVWRSQARVKETTGRHSRNRPWLSSPRREDGMRFDAVGCDRGTASANNVEDWEMNPEPCAARLHLGEDDDVIRCQQLNQSLLVQPCSATRRSFSLLSMLSAHTCKEQVLIQLELQWRAPVEGSRPGSDKKNFESHLGALDTQLEAFTNTHQLTIALLLIQQTAEFGIPSGL